MLENKELSLDELEQISSGIDSEHLAELNKLMKKCYDAVNAKDKSAFYEGLSEIYDYRDAHPEDHDYCSNIIHILKEVGKTVVNLF